MASWTRAAVAGARHFSFRVHGRNTDAKHSSSQQVTFIIIIIIYFLIFNFIIIIRPHRSTTYIDAAYSYQPSSVVCRSVCHTSEPCKNDRAAAWVEDLGGLGNHVLDGGPDPPVGMVKFLGENGCPIVKYRDTLRSSVQRRLNR